MRSGRGGTQVNDFSDSAMALVAAAALCLVVMIALSATCLTNHKVLGDGGRGGPSSIKCVNRAGSVKDALITSSVNVNGSRTHGLVKEL